MNAWIAVTAWLACGVLSTGFTFAHLQASFPEIAAEEWRGDLGVAMLFGVFGPIALVVAFMVSGFGKYGWRLWPKGR